MTLLRLSTQQSRTGPVIDGVLRLIANHLDLPIFESTPEVRVLCSAGITQHRCSYDPVRLPPEPPPVATLRPLPSLTTGLPRLLEPPFQRAVPTTPRRITWVLVSICSPRMQPSPNGYGVRAFESDGRHISPILSRFRNDNHQIVWAAPLRQIDSALHCTLAISKGPPAVIHCRRSSVRGWG